MGVSLEQGGGIADVQLGVSQAKVGTAANKSAVSGSIGDMMSYLLTLKTILRSEGENLRLGIQRMTSYLNSQVPPPSTPFIYTQTREFQFPNNHSPRARMPSKSGKIQNTFPHTTILGSHRMNYMRVEKNRLKYPTKISLSSIVRNIFVLLHGTCSTFSKWCGLSVILFL